LLIYSVLGLAKAQDSATSLRASWQDGLTLASPANDLLFTIGGRIHADFAYTNYSEALEATLGNQGQYATRFTRLRVYQKGQIGPNFSYSLDLDLDEGTAALRDVYIRLRKLPVIGNVRIGYQKEFFSTESMTSSNHIVFMDRSLGDGFVPRRNPGVTVFNTYKNERLTTGGGIYLEADEFGRPSDPKADAYNLTGRLVAVPWRQDEAQQVIVSGALSRRSRDSVRLSGSPEASITLDYLDPPDIGNARFNLVTNYMIGGLCGPVSIQAAYREAHLRKHNTTVRLDALYGQVSYFLTGEHRQYLPASGDFGAVQPRQDFNLQENGAGAVALAFRYSKLDLNDGAYQGGQLTDYTAGLNWYLNPNTRVMVNYFISDVADGGRGRILQTRFQVAF
jgi:phosphate-selective porin OprO/OprP